MKISVDSGVYICLAWFMAQTVIPATAKIENFSPYSQDLPAEAQGSPDTQSLDNSVNARLARLTGALKKYPNNASILENRALAYAECGNYSEAWHDISKAIECKPERYELRWTRAQIDIELKKFQEGLEDCEFARKADVRRAWVSYWIRARIMKAMGHPKDSVSAAENALYNIENLGVHFDYERGLVEPLLNNHRFSAHKKTQDKEKILTTIKVLSQLQAPPDNKTLAELLCLKSGDFYRPFKAPNENMMLVHSNDTPWLRVLKEFVGDKQVYRGLEIFIDIDRCSITEQDLVTELGASKPQITGLGSPGGPEEVLEKEAPHCKLHFILQPAGFKSLTSVQFNW